MGKKEIVNMSRLTGVIDTPAQISLPPIAKNDLLYCIRVKESGYQELVVYRMKWE